VLLALLALVGHACGVPPFYGRFSFWPSPGMALPTALLLTLLGAGALCARPDRGLTLILLSPGGGGVVARRLLLAPVLVPLALGLLSLAARRAGAYDPELGNWLFALANITASTLIIWAIAAALHGADLRRARAEEALRDANRELRRANEELEAFNYSISHDLRSPLTGAGGFAELLLAQYADALPAEARESLRHIRDSTRRMARLVEDLLTFSRLGRQPLRREVVSMAELVRGCLAELRGEAAGRRVELRLAELPGCEGDAALLRQVWLNLLSNALKYTRGRDPAVVEVGCRAAGGGGAAVYFVRDNGAGFDMAQAGRLFGAFQRLHPAEEFAGTGVGLTIVRRVVERHGGRAWAEAEPGKGARFSFTVGVGPVSA
jgi:signal transduction histidine kinase